MIISGFFSFIAEVCVGNKNKPWVGFDDIVKEGVWKWSDRGVRNSVTTSWARREPNNSGGHEDCAHIKSKDGTKLLLNDQECSDNLTYICEV